MKGVCLKRFDLLAFFGAWVELLARPEGLEPPTPWFEAKCSIQLSYGRAAGIIAIRIGLSLWRFKYQHG